MKSYEQLHILCDGDGLGIIFRETDRNNHTGLHRAIKALSESTDDDPASGGYKIFPTNNAKENKYEGFIVFDDGSKDWDYDEVDLMDFRHYRSLDKIDIDYWGERFTPPTKAANPGIAQFDA